MESEGREIHDGTWVRVSGDGRAGKEVYDCPRKDNKDIVEAGVLEISDRLEGLMGGGIDGSE